MNENPVQNRHVLTFVHAIVDVNGSSFRRSLNRADDAELTETVFHFFKWYSHLRLRVELRGLLRIYLLSE